MIKNKEPVESTNKEELDKEIEEVKCKIVPGLGEILSEICRSGDRLHVW
jgi:hypothetical protein